MTARTGVYRVTVAGGLRMATGPLALIAANVAALAAGGYRVWVRDGAGDDHVVEVFPDVDHLRLIYHPGPGAAGDAPAWVDRLSALLAEISDTPTNQERSTTP